MSIIRGGNKQFILELNRDSIASRIPTCTDGKGYVFTLGLTARNLYQLNANEVPLSLHYGFEGRIIILHKIHTDGDYKMTQNAWTFSAR